MILTDQQRFPTPYEPEVAELLRLPVSAIYTWRAPDAFPTSRSAGRCDSARGISKPTWPSAAALTLRLGFEGRGSLHGPAVKTVWRVGFGDVEAESTPRA